MIPNWPWTERDQRYTIYICFTSVPEFQISIHLAPRSALFFSSHFETSAPNDPKWSWRLQGERYSIYVPIVPKTKFKPYRFTASRVQVTGHFEKNALYDVKMTWDAIYMRSNVPYAGLTVTAVTNPFGVTYHLEKSAPNDPKGTLNTKGYPI